MIPSTPPRFLFVLLTVLCFPDFSAGAETAIDHKEIRLYHTIKPTLIFPAKTSFDNQHYAVGVLQAGVDVGGTVLLAATVTNPLGLPFGLAILAGNRLAGLPLNMFLTNEYNKSLQNRVTKGFIPLFSRDVLSRRRIGICGEIGYGAGHNLLGLTARHQSGLISFFVGQNYNGGQSVEVKGEKYLWSRVWGIYALEYSHVLLEHRIFELAAGVKATRAKQSYYWVLGDGIELPEKSNADYYDLTAMAGLNIYLTHFVLLNLGVGYTVRLKDYLDRVGPSWGENEHWDSYREFIDVPVSPGIKFLYWF